MIPSLLLPRPPPPQHFSLDQWHTSLALDAHGGANSDAALSLRLVALSRLVRSKEAITLEHVARSPLATALLTALHALVLRVAAAAPDADPGLNDATIRMMFELPGSATRHQGQYGDFGPVQSRLPWVRFKLVATSLLDVLTTARQHQSGYAIGSLLLASTPTAPVNAAGQAAIAALITYTEPLLSTRIAAGTASEAGNRSSSSSSSSSSGSARSTPAGPPPLPPPPAIVVPGVAVPPPATFAILPANSLLVNLQELVQTRLGRTLTPSESSALAAALDEGLSVLQPGSRAPRQQLLLTANVLTALATPSAAWLWAAAVEASESDPASVEALATAIVDSCSGVAGTLFVSVAAMLDD